MFLCGCLTFSPSSRRRSRDVLSVLCSSSGPPDSSSCSWSWSWLSSSAPSAVDRDLFRGAFTRPEEHKTHTKNSGAVRKVTFVYLIPYFLILGLNRVEDNVRTLDSCDGVLSMLGFVMRGLSFCTMLYRVLIHARISRQQTHVVLFTVIADGSPIAKRLLLKLKRREMSFPRHSNQLRWQPHCIQRFFWQSSKAHSYSTQQQAFL